MTQFEHRSITDNIKAVYLRHPWLYSALLVLLLGAVLWGSSIDSGGQGVTAVPTAADEETRIFQFVVRTLNESEQSSMDEVATSIVERLNQWIGKLDDKEPWRPDPFAREKLVGTLNPQLVTMNGLDQLEVLNFDVAEGFAIQESMWLYQLAGSISRGPATNLIPADAPADLQKVTQLFDWTVRNIALEPEDDSVPRLPWEVVLLGRGRPIDRAWLFVLLCRQAKFDAVMLGWPGTAEEEKTWLPAVLVKGQLYLFDHNLGLPIIRPDGSLATLAEIVADDSEAILHNMDLPGHPYPVSKGQLNDLIALVEISPHVVTRKMFILENHLAGKLSYGQGDKYRGSIILSAKPAELVDRIRQQPGITDCRAWELPYRRRVEKGLLAFNDSSVPQERQEKNRELIARANQEMGPLMLNAMHISQTEGVAVNEEAARLLAAAQDPSRQETDKERRERQAREHTKEEVLYRVLLQGRLLSFEGFDVGDRSAAWFYQKGRPSDDDLVQLAKQIELQAEELADLIRNSQVDEATRRMAMNQRDMNQTLVPLKKNGRETATIWLGLLHYQVGNYQESISYFRERFLDVPEYADSPWRPEARYNLARALERVERDDAAAKAEDIAQALAIYDSETNPLFVKQAAARGAWIRRNQASSATDASASGEQITAAGQ